jgi:hypothetical protein
MMPILFAALVPATVQAAPTGQCAPRDAVVAFLSDRYGETRRSIGLSANNAVMEVFASEQSGTWTVTVTLPDGRTCLLASGSGFEDVAAAELPGEDA